MRAEEPEMQHQVPLIFFFLFFSSPFSFSLHGFADSIMSHFSSITFVVNFVRCFYPFFKAGDEMNYSRHPIVLQCIPTS